MPANVIAEVTADGSRIVLMAAGDVYEAARAQSFLKTLTPLISPTQPMGGLELPLSWPAVVQLSHTFGEHFRPQERLAAWVREQIQARTEFPTELSVTLPSGLVPRSYQVSGALLLRALGSALIFDEAGTGKTATTILGLLEREAAGFDVLPALIICPAAVVESWIEHVQNWAPKWEVVAWRGSPAQRVELAGKYDVYVTSYDTMRRDAPSSGSGKRAPLLDLGAVSVVGDEVHKAKNQQTAQSQALRRLARQAENFIGLSGTPITHHVADLWPALACLVPGAWPSRERWVRRYCITLQGDYRETILGLAPATEPEFRLALLGQHRRVAKADVLKELPPKVYSVRTVELPAEYRVAYDQMESQMLAELPDGTELSAMGVLAQLTRLAQLASAAAEVTVTTERVLDKGTGLETERQHQHVRLRAPSWKVDELLEVLGERPETPVVVFAPSRQLIMLAGEAASRAGYQVKYIVGGQTARQRTEAIDAFQRGEIDVICVTTGAGGVGVTLTAASCAVFLSRPYSIVESLQAEDRIHRLGSERHDSIEIIDIVAADTIDARVRKILKERGGALADLLKDPRIVTELLGGNAKLGGKAKKNTTPQKKSGTTSGEKAS